MKRPTVLKLSYVFKKSLKIFIFNCKILSQLVNTNLVKIYFVGKEEKKY